MRFFKRSQKTPRHLDPKRRNIYKPPPEAAIKRVVDERAGADNGISAAAARPADAPDLGGQYLGIRVDVQTREGFERGLKRLLDLFEEMEIHATFFLNMGPDRSGRGLKSVMGNPEIWKGLLNLKRRAGIGWGRVLSGLFLPAKSTGAAYPEIARAITEKGHEAGILAWDSWTWQDKVTILPDHLVLGDLEAAMEAFHGIFGEEPGCSGSPGFVCTDETLRHMSKRGVRYASDSRGTDPFLPVLSSGQVLATPQVPVTLSTVAEALVEDPSAAPESFYEATLERMTSQDWPVMCVSAEWEGGPFLEPFRAFLKALPEKGRKPTTLGDLVAKWTSSKASRPRCTLSYAEVEGRPRLVTHQMLEV